LLEVLTDGIRAHLGKPDTGDLLIALSAVSESLAARALSELGVDAAGLAEAVARMRSNGVVLAEDAIERTRQRKEVALEAEEFELARQLRE
jgi:ClpA/ClpB-like protein